VRDQETKGNVEEAILFVIQELSETTYDRYSAGDLSADELKEVYDALRRWTIELENLFRLLDLTNPS